MRREILINTFMLFYSDFLFCFNFSVFFSLCLYLSPSIPLNLSLSVCLYLTLSVYFYLYLSLCVTHSFVNLFFIFDLFGSFFFFVLKFVVAKFLPTAFNIIVDLMSKWLLRLLLLVNVVEGFPLFYFVSAYFQNREEEKKMKTAQTRDYQKHTRHVLNHSIIIIRSEQFYTVSVI